MTEQHERRRTGDRRKNPVRGEDRRQQNVPVKVERRSGKERRVRDRRSGRDRRQP